MAQPASKPKVAIAKIILADLRMTDSYIAHATTRYAPWPALFQSASLTLSHGEAEPRMNLRARVANPKSRYFGQVAIY
jgi:hypothetical protein